MSELVVLAFKTPDAAFQVRDKLVELQKMHLITLEDAAVVTRDMEGKAKVKQATSLVGAGALGGAFWGMLIGLLFFMPWLGFAVGALSGALAGKFSDIGVDDTFIKEVASTIEPGHSAIFLLVRDVTLDKVLPEIQSYNPTVLRTSLSTEDEAKLMEAFGVHTEEETEA